MHWVVRLANASDREHLADLYLAVRRQTFSWVDPLTFRHGDFFSQTQGEIIWVAETPAGEVAGFISLWPPDDFIHMLYVAGPWQSRGAGGALLRALPDWPHQKYRLKCLVQNTRAKVFYLANGFVVTGNGKSAEGMYDEMSFFPAG
ncbi:GNAT family N-acetyltransferase [Rhizobium grahamii]|uniref:GNAT family N-acetyltransferase n=1 Tax=Rhizobium grahamii TaxID=1120045 RepID=A0A5Q0CCM7_9HYPH|nr:MULTISPECIES: GNAT family N-acetyltransferase [Rhizobium]QFY62214.1 GNAT family N-acetyltransferase [Rhizobium grahamii]QRM48600.1 GNAT family N-acetyltransferase [Rhizobium sp. BG6]